METSTISQDTPDFPMSRTAPLDPPPRYADLRADAPISQATLPGGRTAWLISRHDLVRQILIDRRLTSDRTHPNFPLPVEIPRESLLKQRAFSRALIGADPPEHTARRRMVLAEFTVRRMHELRPRIQQIVDEHIDALLAGPNPADLVAALALPVPSMVI